VSETPEPPDGRPRRRTSWSLKSIVEEVGGRPLSDYQDPDRPPHPYVRLMSRPPVAPASAPIAHLGTRTAPRATPAAEPAPEVEEEPQLSDPDPVARVYPPLTGATGRGLHGPENEHHRETLEAIRPDDEPPSPGQRAHPPGPSKRPERIYLHYLLLHIDRLSDHALRYLDHAVREELDHRATGSSEPAPHPPG
jgi:hypothetical protein